MQPALYAMAVLAAVALAAAARTVLRYRAARREVLAAASTGRKVIVLNLLTRR